MRKIHSCVETHQIWLRTDFLSNDFLVTVSGILVHGIKRCLIVYWSPFRDSLIS